MRLRKLSVKGYRSIKSDENLVTDERVTILIGANDHGKSNLLAAILCLNDDHEIGADDRNWDLDANAPVEITWHFKPTAETVERLKKFSPPPLPEKNPAGAEKPAPTPEAPAPQASSAAPTPEVPAVAAAANPATPPAPPTTPAAAPGDTIGQIAFAEGITLGKTIEEVTKAWFAPKDKISKLLIAIKYEDKAETSKAAPPEAAQTELEKIKELLDLRSEKSKRSGVFEEVEQ